MKKPTTFLMNNKEFIRSIQGRWPAPCVVSESFLVLNNEEFYAIKILKILKGK